MNRSHRGVLPAVAALAAFLGVLVVTGTAAPAPAPAPAEAVSEAVSEAAPEAAMEALRKCPLDWNRFPDAPQWGVVVDGVLVAEGIDAIRSLSVQGTSPAGAVHKWGRTLEARFMCAEDLYNRMGVIVRNHAMVIHTEEGPVAPALALLSELADRQQAHFGAHGRFAATPGELDWSPSEAARTLTEGLTITLVEGAAGWTTILEVEGYPSTCGVFGGTAEPLADRAPKHTPLCPVSLSAAVR